MYLLLLLQKKFSLIVIQFVASYLLLLYLVGNEQFKARLSCSLLTLFVFKWLTFTFFFREEKHEMVKELSLMKIVNIVQRPL